MVKKFSTSWKSSTQTRKQRKFRYNAPNHIKHRFMSATLSSDLRSKHGIRNVPVRLGDTVEVTTGQFSGQSGKVAKVSLAKTKVYVEGITQNKRDGTSVMYPIHPSNLKITALDLSDDLRKAKIEKRAELRKGGAQE